MIKNTKGLSAIVGTLLILLLVIIAVGIVWGVLRGTVEEGADKLKAGTACLGISVKTTIADCSSSTTCDVTLYREAGGDTMDGAKIAISDGLASYVHDEEIAMKELETATITGIDFTSSDVVVANIASIETSVYIKDSNGEKNICPGTHSFVDVQLP